MKRMVYSKIAFLILTVFLSVNNIKAQGNQDSVLVDSLQEVLSKQNYGDTAYVSLQIDIASSIPIWRISHWDSINNLALAGLSENSQEDVHLSYFKSHSRAINALGFMHYSHGDIATALEFFLKNLELSKTLNDSSELAIALNNVGAMYKFQGIIPVALDYYQKSLKIKEQIKDLESLSVAYNNIGDIYEQQGNIKVALEYFKKSLDINEKLNYKVGLVTSYINIGSIYASQSSNELALKCFKDGLELAKEVNDLSGLAALYINIGHLLKSQNKLDESLIYFKKSSDLEVKLEDKDGMALSYLAIGETYFLKGDYDKAEEISKKGYELASLSGFVETQQGIAQLISDIAFQKGQYQKALEYRNIGISLRDSTENDESLIAVTEAQASYEYEKQQAIREAVHSQEMNSQNELAKANESKQTITIISVSVVLFLFIVFSIFLFNRFKITSKQKLLIEKQKNILEVKNKETLDSIQYAKRIQQAILPSVDSLQKELKNAFVLFLPKDVVAGDFYWMEKRNNVVWFAAADCTGHGVPGAMMSVVCSNSLSIALMDGQAKSTGDLLDKTRDIVISRLAKSGEEVHDGMDISLGAINFENNTLEWSGANNPLWIVRQENLLEFKPDKQPIGDHPLETSFISHKIDLQKEDVIYLPTDGFQDQFGGENQKKYKPSQLKKKLLEISQTPINQQQEALKQEFLQWKGHLEQVDDICIIGIRI